MPSKSPLILVALLLLSRASATSALAPPTSTNRRTWGARRLPSCGVGGSRRASSKPTAPEAATVAQIRGGGGASAMSLSPDAVRLAETLAPKVGILTSTALYFAPAAAVLSAVRSDDIGDLNPIPLAVMAVVSVSWLAYGLSARDPYVALSNIVGCVGSIGYVLGILPLLRDRTELLRLTQGVVLAGTAAALGLWTFLGLSGATAAQVSSSLGTFASCLFIVLAGSPLSTIGKVLSARDSGSILGPLTAAQVINCALWSAYGLAVRDRFVWGPNLAGLGLGLAQLVLKILFPSKKLAAAS